MIITTRARWVSQSHAIAQATRSPTVRQKHAITHSHIDKAKKTPTCTNRHRNHSAKTVGETKAHNHTHRHAAHRSYTSTPSLYSRSSAISCLCWSSMRWRSNACWRSACNTVILPFHKSTKTIAWLQLKNEHEICRNHNIRATPQLCDSPVTHTTSKNILHVTAPSKILCHRKYYVTENTMSQSRLKACMASHEHPVRHFPAWPRSNPQNQNQW